MTVAETILVFAGIPLAIVAVLAAWTLRPAKGRRRLRYKPGQPWDHAPVWYEPHPEHSGGGHGPAPAHGPAAVAGSSTAALGSSMYPEQHGDGAHEAGAGASAAGAAAGRPHPGGPLGGARGTW